MHAIELLGDKAPNVPIEFAERFLSYFLHWIDCISFSKYTNTNTQVA
jgi:hypothetical protein